MNLRAFLFSYADLAQTIRSHCHPSAVRESSAAMPHGIKVFPELKPKLETRIADFEEKPRIWLFLVRAGSKFVQA